MPTKVVKPDTHVYQLKITLRGSKPPIWRRLLVPPSLTLAKLHYVIQAAMGWHDSHLHEFSVGEQSYGPPELRADIDGMISERTITLGQIAAEVGANFSYQYDFGDYWDHHVQLEKITPIEQGSSYPLCIAGRRACPPEDVGGIWGYAEMLETISNPANPERAEMLAWVGADFDPASFDLAATNNRLKLIR